MLSAPNSIPITKACFQGGVWPRIHFENRSYGLYSSMAFTLSLRRAFVADHFHDLPGFQEDRHGHNWDVEAAVEFASEAEEPAFAEALDTWVAAIDYRLLNDLPPLEGRNPTAEVLAEHAFDHLRNAALKPIWVKVREKSNYWALCSAGNKR